ncbi:hypothetical protein [Alkalihalophilus marmarensis]|uniref:hypothetical protein n=1 Tax=Alkalihalophilus marmarensis TaxID=521377 RepID=UPI002E204B50|nr:hypothetical protein [Alkalihalophilus marmarensis]
MNKNYQNVVKQAFQNHGVDNPELENAITDILNQALDSRTLARNIWKDVQECIDSDKSIKSRFR